MAGMTRLQLQIMAHGVALPLCKDRVACKWADPVVKEAERALEEMYALAYMEGAGVLTRTDARKERT
jgi:hypothetical protein